MTKTKKQGRGRPKKTGERTNTVISAHLYEDTPAHQLILWCLYRRQSGNLNTAAREMLYMACLEETRTILKVQQGIHDSELQFLTPTDILSRLNAGATVLNATNANKQESTKTYEEHEVHEVQQARKQAPQAPVAIDDF